MTTEENTRYLLYIAVLVIAFMAAIFGSQTVGLPLREVDGNPINTYEVAQSLIAVLIVLAVFLERALEVYVSTVRQPGRPNTDAETFEFQHLKGQVPDGAKADDALQAKIDAAQKALTEKQKELDLYRAETMRIIHVVMVLAAILLSIVGPRTLDEFYALPGPGTLIGNLSHFIDILLTAGLIGGGAKGINKVSQVLGSYSDKAASASKATTTG